MDRITPDIFKKYTLEQRYRLLKERGEHIGGRFWTDYNVHLYALDGFFVEVWIKIGVNQIYWIEVQSKKEILVEYADNVDIRKMLE